MEDQGSKPQSLCERVTPLNYHILDLQGKAGSLNNFTLVLVDELGRQLSGLASSISASIAQYPPPPTNIVDSSSIKAVVDCPDGTVNVSWTATAALPATIDLLYQLNVTLKMSQQVRLRDFKTVTIIPTSHTSALL